jgi:hypothetical protein
MCLKKKDIANPTNEMEKWPKAAIFQRKKNANSQIWTIASRMWPDIE